MYCIVYFEAEARLVYFVVKGGKNIMDTFTVMVHLANVFILPPFIICILKNRALTADTLFIIKVKLIKFQCPWPLSHYTREEIQVYEMYCVLCG